MNISTFSFQHKVIECFVTILLDRLKIYSIAGLLNLHKPTTTSKKGAVINNITQKPQICHINLQINLQILFWLIKCNDKKQTKIQYCFQTGSYIIVGVYSLSLLFIWPSQILIPFGASTTWFGRVFHGSVTRKKNQCFLTSSLGLSLKILYRWPLVLPSILTLNKHVHKYVHSL